MVQITNVMQIPDSTSSFPQAPSNTTIQRLLDIVEAQSETIETQSKRIQTLEDQQMLYIKALSKLEARVESMTIKGSKGSETLNDED